MLLYTGRPAEEFVDEITLEVVDVTDRDVTYPDRVGVFTVRKVTDMWHDGRSVYNATQDGSFAFHICVGQKLDAVNG
jgi:hypothetical protein